MPRTLRPRLTYANVIASIALFVALGGGAIAATGAFTGRDGKIHGCVSKKGQLKVLKPPAVKCPTGQKAIAWSQKGPAGKKGQPGPKGPKGDTGDSGLATGPAGGQLTGSYPNPSIADGVITAAKVAAANKDGLAGVPSLRTLGTGALQAMPGNASPGGPPTGSAGGALAGSYPSPTLNVSGGPCASGQFVTNLSTTAALTCGPMGTNAALGQAALLSNSDGGSNSALGFHALVSNTTGSFNSAIGRSALSANTEGFSNSAVGSGALFSNTTADNNSALGDSALLTNSTGTSNSAVGRDALTANTTGSENTAVGVNALKANTTASNSSAVGNDALAASTGTFNSALGDNALDSVTSGTRNTAVGRDAGQGLTTGSRNSLFGYTAGNALTGGDSSNIAIGHAGVAGDNNTIRIGTEGAGLSQQNKAFLAGVTTSNLGAQPAVLVDASGRLGVNTSSRRFKRDIEPLGPAADRLMALRPVSFYYKPRYLEGPKRRQFGLIAEEVAKVYPNLVTHGRDGKPYTVLYQELPALLLAQLQREHRRADRQQREIDRLAAQVRALQGH